MLFCYFEVHSTGYTLRPLNNNLAFLINHVVTYIYKFKLFIFFKVRFDTMMPNFS